MLLLAIGKLALEVPDEFSTTWQITGEPEETIFGAQVTETGFSATSVSCDRAEPSSAAVTVVDSS